MSVPKIEIGPVARRDIDSHTKWLFDEAGAAIADRFADATTLTFKQLAQTTGMGSPVFYAGALSDTRKWRIKGFPNVLIFYRPTTAGIRIVRVLHASQDWAALLDSR